MTLPFAYTPVLQTKAESRLTTCLHQITEIVAIAGITIEYIVGITYKRFVCLHKVVRLWLLLSWLDLIYSTVFEHLALLLLLGEIIEIALIAILRQSQPIHHIPGIVKLKERHQLITDLIYHLCRESKMERFAFD